MSDLTKITATLPSTDIARTKDFYENKLGLKPVPLPDMMKDSALFSASDSSMIFLYTRPASVAEHTLASFSVTDMEKTVDELMSKGIVFEHYDTPGTETNEKGISVHGDIKSAWFKDPDGNILGLVEM